MKLFGTDGIRGKANKSPLTPEGVVKIGKSLASVLNKKSNLVVLGGDTRISTPMIASALSSALTSMGLDVAVADIIPTPAVALMVLKLEADAGLVVSASHNPWFENGIKFFNNKGFKFSVEEESLVEEAFEKEIKGNNIGKIFSLRWEDTYVEYLRSLFNMDLSNLKIVVDCANGATSFIAPRVFESFNNKPIVINNQPDGTNINKGGANDLGALKQEVLKNNADIGIAFDGDGDRIAIIDENGNILDGDSIMGIIARELKQELDAVAVTRYSNAGFVNSMQELGISCEFAETGDRYVNEKMQKLNIRLGGENSGHIIMSDYSTTGDGILTGLKILEIMHNKKKKLSELDFVKKFPQVLVNKEVKEKTPLEQLPEVSKRIKRVEEILKGQGKVFVRYSGTQNLVRILVEGPSMDLIKAYAELIADGFDVK